DIPVETVYASTKEVDGKPTGYIEITSFSEETYFDFEQELSKLEKEGIEGLVIDVRGNPEGLLDSVEDMLGEFVQKDIPFVHIEDQNRNKEIHISDLDNNKDNTV